MLITLYQIITSLAICFWYGGGQSHFAWNLLRQENTAKCGIKAKRLKTGCDEKYLLKVLADLF